MADNTVRQLRGEEGEKLHAYKDHLGYLTIGVGRLIDSRKGGGLTPEESAYLLANDIARKSAELDKAMPWWRDLDEARRSVLLQMAFQMGVDGLAQFTNTLRKVRAGDYLGASLGMLDSLWAKQTPERAKRMADQMRTGLWQFKPGH